MVELDKLHLRKFVAILDVLVAHVGLKSKVGTKKSFIAKGWSLSQSGSSVL